MTPNHHQDVPIAERLFIWAGATLFAASLAATTWLYVHRFAAPAVFRSSSAIVDATLLTIFAAHHSLFARPWMKKAVAPLLPARFVRPVYVWVASLLLLGVVGAWQTVGGEVYDVGGAAGWLLVLVQFGGVLLVVRAASAIRPLELAGVRSPRPDEALHAAGPYGLVRHPIYLGWVLMVWATPHLTGDRLTFAAVTTAYLVVAIPWEERDLTEAFGADYLRYAARVRWRLLPFVY
jgi:protein-S-isoprenylcysteine O-methyltransferase Ste14